MGVFPLRAHSIPIAKNRVSSLLFTASSLLHQRQFTGKEEQQRLLQGVVKTCAVMAREQPPPGLKLAQDA